MYSSRPDWSVENHLVTCKGGYVGASQEFEQAIVCIVVVKDTSTNETTICRNPSTVLAARNLTCSNSSLGLSA